MLNHFLWQNTEMKQFEKVDDLANTVTTLFAVNDARMLRNFATEREKVLVIPPNPHFELAILRYASFVYNLDRMDQVIPPASSRNASTLPDYFDLAERGDVKLEYHDGEIVAMAGGTESHSLITTNVIAAMSTRLRDKPCRVYDSNLRVSPSTRKKYYYPDVLVVCGEKRFDANDPRQLTISNPTLIVEVLSDGTENFDRDKKFLAYIRAESLKEYVLIAQHTARVQTYFRQPDGTWAFAFAEGRDAVAHLRNLQIDLPLGEVYAKVDLPVAVD